MTQQLNLLPPLNALSFWLWGGGVGCVEAGRAGGFSSLDNFITYQNRGPHVCLMYLVYISPPLYSGHYIIGNLFKIVFSLFGLLAHVEIVSVPELLEAAISFVGIAPIPVVRPPFARLVVVGASVGDHRVPRCRFRWPQIMCPA